MQEKILVLDIDGTLTNSKKRSQKQPKEESGIFCSMAIRSFWLPAVRLPA